MHKKVGGGRAAMITRLEENNTHIFKCVSMQYKYDVRKDKLF